jgi:iron complex outermembrane receptor protein
MRNKILAVMCLSAMNAFAEDSERLDEVSVTATREARPTGDVPQSIAVVGKADIADRKMFNIKEALQEIPGVLIDSKNGGYDDRLIIRGAGLKAAYGIREIMVLRDGVPVSDPDSFTKLDFIDTQDIERIEVAKGPGNLFAAGSVGGAIQIFSKSVFDEGANNAKIGLGDQGTQNYHLRYGTVGETQAWALTASHRAQDNDWRYWNQFDTTQVSLKHGLMLAKGTLESEVSYSEANMQLPGAMNQTLFDRFVESGEQTSTSDVWKNSGRYSKVLFLNSRYEAEYGNFTFKPRVYYNTWYHYHPVTGIINETEKWVWNLGTDIEGDWKHAGGTLVGGFTVREERTPDSRKYQYRDVTTGFGGRITSTLSDAKGALAEIDDATSLLTGVYLQESWRPSERWIVDAGMRYDVIEFTDDNNQITAFNYATGTYTAGDGVVHSEKTFHLPAPKLAATYKLTDTLSVFGMVAEAGQIPSTSEFTSNPALEAPVSRNYEVGFKGRAKRWEFDASVYRNKVKKEIVQINTGGVTEYVNAGKTEKNGLELSGRIKLTRDWEIGGYYAYSDYTYEEFSEPVRVGFSTVNMNRAGNQLPYIPNDQYGVFVGWKSPTGWRARVSANTWGEYWMDNANTQKYEGWDWVTNLSLGYEQGHHALTLNLDNVFDQHYSVEAKKDTSGNVTYAAASPRSVMLTYQYKF